MDFEQNFEFFKIHKNIYTGPFCITDLQYVGHHQEIQSFSQFLPQTDDIR
jgi:hypothetical protein